MLIVVLALVMVFALVACDPKDDKSKDDSNKGGGPTEADAYKYSSVDYFNDLLEVTDDIGNEKISDDSVYLSADIGIRVGTRKFEKVKGDIITGTQRYEQVIVGYNTEQSTEFGLKLEAILDRKNADSRNTVIKGTLYSGDVEIAGLYYAIAEPDNFYIDFAGQHILFPLHIAFELGEKTYSNDDLGATLYKNIFGKSFTINQHTTTLLEVLNTIVGDMGEEWSFDDLVNGILNLLGFDPQELVKALQGFSPAFADGLVNNGKLSIKRALSNKDISEQLFKAYKNGNTYSVTSTMLEDLIGSSIIPKGSRAEAHFYLSYLKEGNAIKDGVTINLDVEDTSYAVAMNGKHPFVAIQIKDMEFGDSAKHPINVNKSAYKKDVQLEVKNTLDISGVTLNGEPLDGPNHDKKFEFGAALKLDFEQKDLSQNGTQANVYVQYDNKKIIDLSYVKGRLAFVVDKNVALCGFSAADKVVEFLGDAIYKGVGDTFFKEDKTKLNEFADIFFEGGATGDHKQIRSDFKGAVWTHIDPNEMLDTVVQKLADFIKTMLDESKKDNTPTSPKSGEQGDATPAMKIVPTSLTDILYTLFTGAKPVLADGKVEFEIGNTLQLVTKIVNKMFGLPIKATDKTPAVPAWTLKGCEEQLKDMIVSMVARSANPEAEQLGKAEIDAAAQLIDNAIKEIFIADAQSKAPLALAGVDFTDKPAESTYLEYLISAVLDNLGAKGFIDFTKGGIDCTLEASFAEVTITYKSEMKVNGNPAAQKDLAEGVASGATGWYVD